VSQLPFEELHVVTSPTSESESSYSIISHEHQIMFKPKSENPDTGSISVAAQFTHTMRRDYWKYIAGHPAHLPLQIMRLRDAHNLALTYLRWCLSGALQLLGANFA
jgi:hypothetical protein